MYSRNILFGQQGGEAEKSLIDTKEERQDGKKKGVDMVTVFVPELTSDNQVYCKSVTSILSNQDYQNYLPVYRPLSQPLISDKREKKDKCCTYSVIITLIAIILICIVILAVIFGAGYWE